MKENVFRSCMLSLDLKLVYPINIRKEDAVSPVYPRMNDFVTKLDTYSISIEDEIASFWWEERAVI